MAENAPNAAMPNTSSSASSPSAKRAGEKPPEAPPAKKQRLGGPRPALEAKYGEDRAGIILLEALRRGGISLTREGTKYSGLEGTLADEAFMASLDERVAEAKKAREEAEAGRPTAEKYAALARTNPQRVRDLCLSNGIIADGTPEELGERLMNPRRPENLLPRTIIGVPPAPRDMTVAETTAALAAIGVRIERVKSKCTLLAIQRRIIKVPAPGDVRKQIPELKGLVKCMGCGRPKAIRIKALLAQADNGYQDCAKSGAVKCSCSPYPGYLSGMCTGQIEVAPYKFHFHCEVCSRDVADARERHCDTCGEHFHDASGLAPCYICNPDATLF